MFGAAETSASPRKVPVSSRLSGFEEACGASGTKGDVAEGMVERQLLVHGMLSFNFVEFRMQGLR